MDENRELVEQLLARGVSRDEIDRATREGRLSVFPLELVLREEGSRSLEEVATMHVVDPEALAATRRALGLPVERGSPVYGDALEDHARRLRTALDADVPLEALLTINRVIGRAMASVTSAARDTMRALLTGVEADESSRSLRVAEATEALLPELEKVLSYALGEHVRETVRAEAGARLVDADQADVREIGVAFADLVGFTALVDGSAPQRVGGIAAHLETLTFDALRPRVSLVKTIGDEVMLASADVPALVATLLDLIDAAESSADLPRLRVGIATGAAMHRAGDWYGAPVNLASRLTALAEPGTLLADQATSQAAPDATLWHAMPDQRIRGVERPVTVRVACPACRTPDGNVHERWPETARNRVARQSREEAVDLSE